jgi:hypothetical protein
MGTVQSLDDTARLAASGLSFGFIDKLAGTTEGGTEAARARTQAARDRQGARGMAVEGVSSMVGPTAVAKAGLTAGNITSNLGRYAGSVAEGAGYGGLMAAGNDQDILTGMGIGGILGPLGQGAGDLIERGAAAFRPLKPTFNEEQLKAAGSAAFKRADDAGVIYKPQAVDRLRGQVYDDFAEFGFHPKNHPGAGVAYDELKRLAQGGNVSLKGLNAARRIAGGGFKADNPSNNELLKGVTRRIDDFAVNATADDVLTGDTQAASAALKEGRDYWSRFRKTEKVQELMERAGLQAGSTGSGGNVENATRQQLKRLLTDKKLTRGMSKDEISAIRKAVLGTNTQNALRLAGKLSPQGNGLMLYLMGAGSIAAPQITIPAMAAGYGAKKAAESMTARNAEMVKRLIAAGGKAENLYGPKTAAQNFIEQNKQALIRALMMGGIGAGNAAVTKN